MGGTAAFIGGSALLPGASAVAVGGSALYAPVDAANQQKRALRTEKNRAGAQLLADQQAMQDQEKKDQLVKENDARKNRMRTLRSQSGGRAGTILTDPLSTSLGGAPPGSGVKTALGA